MCFPDVNSDADFRRQRQKGDSADSRAAAVGHVGQRTGIELDAVLALTRGRRLLALFQNMLLSLREPGRDTRILEAESQPLVAMLAPDG